MTSVIKQNGMLYEPTFLDPVSFEGVPVKKFHLKTTLIHCEFYLSFRCILK